MFYVDTGNSTTLTEATMWYLGYVSGSCAFAKLETRFLLSHKGSPTVMVVLTQSLPRRPALDFEAFCSTSTRNALTY